MSSSVRVPELVFATTNAGKTARLREHLARGARGAETRVRMLETGAHEAQLDTVRAVAIDKALRARDALGRDGADATARVVLAHDCGLRVRALRGFPGPYTKYANETLGGGGLMKLLAGESDDAASWDETLVVCDVMSGRMEVFSVEETYDGGMATPRVWRRWRNAPERSIGACFVPRGFGFDAPLADVSEEEYQRYRRDADSVWARFAAWVESEAFVEFAREGAEEA